MKVRDVLISPRSGSIYPQLYAIATFLSFLLKIMEIHTSLFKMARIYMFFSAVIHCQRELAGVMLKQVSFQVAVPDFLERAMWVTGEGAHLKGILWETKMAKLILLLVTSGKLYVVLSCDSSLYSVHIYVSTLKTITHLINIVFPIAYTL